MVIQNFAQSTVAGYLGAVRQLLSFTGKDPARMDWEDIYGFLIYLKEDRKLSRTSIRIAVGGIRYLYKHLFNQPEIIQEIPYPKKEKVLPVILTGQEVKALFEATSNLKHRSLLKLVYSAGLRRSEVRSLQITDIDSKKMQLHIRQGKGRMALLSKHLLHELKQYIEQYQPKTYLFNGRNKGEKISEGAIRWIMLNGVARAGLKKKVHLHSLRHCFLASP